MPLGGAYRATQSPHREPHLAVAENATLAIRRDRELGLRLQRRVRSRGNEVDFYQLLSEKTLGSKGK